MNRSRYRNVVSPTDYGPVIINRYDNTVGLYISRHGSWEKRELELLLSALQACYKADEEIEILDVGANIGAHTIAFARLPYRKVTVHAIEAQRIIYMMLAGTVALNSLDNVHCYQKAASSVSGEIIEIPAVDYDQPANFSALELESGAGASPDVKRIPGEVEAIETVRIDDLGLKRVRLLKIDVEGMEHKVLAGAGATIANCRPVITLEHHRTDFEAVKSILRSANYHSYYVLPPNIICIPSEFPNVKIKGATPVEY